MSTEATTDGAPPPAFLSAPKRPGSITAAGVFLGVAAVLSWLFAVGGVIVRYGRGYDAEVMLIHSLVPAVSQAAVGLGFAVAAALVLAGWEGGRALGFAMIGIACWLGASALTYLGIDLWQRGPIGLSVYYLVYSGWIAVGALALAAAPLLLNRVALDWFQHRRAARGNQMPPLGPVT
ncbi:MAG: hypothetical protein ACRDTM_14940 [Micromonosporaceae bacterium]